MKKLMVILMLVLMARLPMAVWNEITEEQRGSLADAVFEVYKEYINPKCVKAEISVYDGKDGFAYFDAECKEEKNGIHL